MNRAWFLLGEGKNGCKSFYCNGEIKSQWKKIILPSGTPNELIDLNNVYQSLLTSKKTLRWHVSLDKNT